MFQTMRIAAIAAAAAIGITAASGAKAAVYDHRILLINESHGTIEQFHASNVSRTTYEEDILGDRVVRPGQQVVVNLDDHTGYCRFDFLTVMADGTKIEKRNVDVCTLQRYTITD